jgi:asparagine synthase (glutamine-hydrolysing)
MCGIVGYIGHEVPGKLYKMNTLVTHRGPDAEGFYNDPHYHLAMKRLSIVDIKHGSQPISNNNRSIIVLFNGEIYNYQNLKKYLEIDFNITFETNSDVEVILKLYEVLGTECLQKIEGMYAICILDKNIDTLYLIRDRYGKKPIYYYQNKSENYIEFASEFNVINLHNKGKSLSAEALNWYFSNKTTLTSTSVNKFIKKVNPGCYIAIKKKTKVTETKYYSHKSVVSKQKFNEVDLVRNINDLLIASVKKRLIGEVEIGAFLSGGLDSSLIVAILSKLSNLPIRTYSLVYNKDINEKENDRKFANLVSRSFNTRHQEILLTPELLASELKNIVKAYGEPNSSVLSNWFVSKEMGKDIKVALSGDGADELFGSYKTHRLARFQDEVLSNDAELKDFKDFGLCEKDVEVKKTFFEIINSNFVFNQQELKLLLNDKYFIPNFLENIVSNNLPSNKVSRLDNILYFDFKTLLPNQILSYIDLLGMAHSVEIRCPFLDNSLVDFVLSIENSSKINKGETKYILKKAAECFLPKELIYRKKEGFVEPSVYWIYDELKDFTKHHIYDCKFNSLGIINLNYAHSLVDSFYSKEFDFNTAKKVWTLLIFSIWENIYCAQ